MVFLDVLEDRVRPRSWTCRLNHASVVALLVGVGCVVFGNLEQDIGEYRMPFDPGLKPR